MITSSDSSSEEDVNIRHRRVNTQINFELEIGEHRGDA